MSRRHVALGLMWGLGVGMFARAALDQIETLAGYIRPATTGRKHA